VSDSVAAVIAGLAVGIGFVLTVSYMQAPAVPNFYPDARQSQDNSIASAAYNLKEVQAFREKFPFVGATGYSSESGMVVCYTYPSIPCDHEENDDKIVAYLEVRMDAEGNPIDFKMYCNTSGGTAVMAGQKIDVIGFFEKCQALSK
jgi:hypothetical protein